MAVSRLHHHLPVQHDDAPLAGMDLHGAIAAHRFLYVAVYGRDDDAVARLQAPFQPRPERDGIPDARQPVPPLPLLLPPALLPHPRRAGLGLRPQARHHRVERLLLAPGMLRGDVPLAPAFLRMVIVPPLVRHHDAAVRQLAAETVIVLPVVLQDAHAVTVGERTGVVDQPELPPAGENVMDAEIEAPSDDVEVAHPREAPVDVPRAAAIPAPHLQQLYRAEPRHFRPLLIQASALQVDVGGLARVVLHRDDAVGQEPRAAASLQPYPDIPVRVHDARPVVLELHRRKPVPHIEHREVPRRGGHGTSLSQPPESALPVPERPQPLGTAVVASGQGRAIPQVLHQLSVRHDRLKRPARSGGSVFRPCRGRARRRPRPCGRTAFPGKPALEHRLPVPVSGGQAEEAVKPHVVDYHAALLPRGLAQPAPPVISGDVPRVADADGVHDALPAFRVLPDAFIQPPDARASVQRGVHLLHLEVPVRAPFPQAVYQPLLLAVRTDGHVVEGGEPSLPDEIRYALRGHQRVEQVRESPAVQPAGRGGHAQLPRLGVAQPQLPVGPGERMVGLVYHDQARPFVPHLLPMP